MFIVLTVIAVLSAIGAYAMSNSRYEVRTAGFVRQRSLSEQVNGVGGMAASAEFGAAPDAYLQLIRNRGRNPPGNEQCIANGGLGSTGPTSGLPPCYHLYLKDVQNRSGVPFVQMSIPGSSGAPGTPGSLGLTQLNVGFLVELTDPMNVIRPVPGMPIDGSPGTPTFIDVTVTATGVVFQDLPGGTADFIDANERPSATFTTGRGHVVVGPIYATK